MTISRILLAAGTLAVAAAGAGLAYQARSARPRFERQIAWAGAGVWLKAETHVHTKFSDGGPFDAVIDHAMANGCDVLAITDHTDGNLIAATPEYHAAIAAARARAPNMTILTGIEWNVPPGKGQDHAVVLFPPELDDAVITGEFKTRFDDFNKEGENPELAVEAFEWLRARAKGASAPVVMFLDHPSRRAPDIAAVDRQISWLARIGASVFAGAEGAPGHQHADPLGAYGKALKPEDRWDPAIAPPGQAWDRALARGEDIWGALATSDFHAPSNGDYWPCEFSATWIYAPDRSIPGVLRALRAGAFVGEHGHIVRDVEFSASADGLPRAAIPGETIKLPAGASVRLRLRATVPPVDWNGAPNRIDAIEFIATAKANATLLHRGTLDADGAIEYALTVPAGGIVIRARGRRVVDDGPDLLFYTNPIRIR